LGLIVEVTRRADRLFEIIEALRRARGPITADAIARELETSKRTIYRDIAALIARRVPIHGEAGIGYVLKSGFYMPPIMLTSDEIEAIVLGAQWVSTHADPALAIAAAAVLAKIADVVPERLRGLIEEPAVITPAWKKHWENTIDVARLRLWCQQGRKLFIHYRDATGQPSERTVWPFLVGYLAEARVLMAWCEFRQDFRIFRIDRLLTVNYIVERYPEQPMALRRRWIAMMAERADEADMQSAGTAPLTLGY
jgi:predicted DNA-binding transcriptional regulator YafY